MSSLIDEQAYAKAAERLEEAARSLVVFQVRVHLPPARANHAHGGLAQDTSEYEGRRSLMVSLQNQLEASLSAPLVSAINARDVKACRSFRAIFEQIEREPEFTSYYFGSRRSSLVEGWASAKLADDTAFTTYLDRFYVDFLALLNEERSYIPAVFNAPQAVFSDFVQTTLESLSPSMSTRLASSAEHKGASALLELIKAFKATEEFAVAAERAFASYDSPSPGPPTPTKREKRSSSKRLSLSKRHSSSRFMSVSVPNAKTLLFGEHSSAAAPQGWEITLFEPFLDWQSDYGMLERRLLQHQIDASTSQDDRFLSTEDPAKGARLLWDDAASVFALFEGAIGRSFAFTHGYGACGLIEAVDTRFVNFMEGKKERIRERGRAGRRAGRSENGHELDLEGLDYTADDWETFQLSLRLLDTSRSVNERLGSFDQKLRSRLSVLAQSMKADHYSVPGTTRGEMSLLHQSTLNSADLAALLDSLDGGSKLPLLPRSHVCVTEFTRSVQQLLHDTVLAPLMARLREYPSLSDWTTLASQRPGAKGAFDLAIPTFSLSPTETIARVGEGLLNLPRLFELHVDDDALAFSIETLPYLDVEALRAMQEYQQEAAAAATAVTSPSATPSLAQHGRRSSALAVDADDAPSPQLDTGMVISAWLSSLTLSVFSYISTVVLPSISRVSKHGAAQLASDLDYITNVARTLDTEPGEDFDAWKELLSLSDDAGRKRYRMAGGSPGDVLARVARMRGWR